MPRTCDDIISARKRSLIADDEDRLTTSISGAGSCCSWPLDEDSSCLYCPPPLTGSGESSSHSTSSHSDLASSRRASSVTGCRPRVNSTGDCRTSGSSSCFPRYKPIYEGDILVSRSTPCHTVLGKLFANRMFKRWESCRIKFLNDGFSCQSNATASPVIHFTKYSDIRQLSIFPRNAKTERVHKPCIRVTLVDHQILIQAKNSHICNQWFYTLHWRNRLNHGKQLLANAKYREEISAELRSLVDYATLCCISHEDVKVSVLNLLSDILHAENAYVFLEIPTVTVVNIFQPILLRVENYILSDQVCVYFSEFFKIYPRSSHLLEVFAPLVLQLLKHNSDFGKRPQVREFIADFFLALMCRSDFEEVILDFVENAHGPCDSCPHIRVLSNLVAVCLASLQLNRPPIENARILPSLPSETDTEITTLLEVELHESGSSSTDDSTEHRTTSRESSPDSSRQGPPIGEQDTRIMRCFLFILKLLCNYEDWRKSLAPLLQPIPFSKTALVCDTFIHGIIPIIDSFAGDSRCEVHTCLLGIRDGKLGWFHLFAPGGLLNLDRYDGVLFSRMLSTLVNCCYKRRKFMNYLARFFMSPILLLASRGDTAMMDVLCLLLQHEILTTADARLEVITTLESSKDGHDRYCRVCQEISKLKELQSKGGPTMLSLPPKSSDQALADTLESGWFGNLESLSLAFTNITNLSADLIVKLPTLKYLNLWSTQFGDQGLQVISDSLVNLQVLNLCETPVTDKGLISLVSIKSLRRLNLNSTKLSPTTFDKLKRQLPLLQEVDIRYTDAW